MPQSKPKKNHRLSPKDGALGVLEAFAQSARISFNRILANRALEEAERAISGDDCQTWSLRMVEVGESLDLRIRIVESDLDDALTFVQQGIPVATCLSNQARDESAHDNLAGGDMQWVLLAQVRGRRLRIASLDASPDTWITLSAFRERLGAANGNAKRRWVVGQAAMSCDAGLSSVDGSDQGHGRADAHTGGDHDSHVPPLRRLLRLMRPEQGDIWVVFVFSAIVGILTLASPVAVEALVNTVAFGQYLQPVIVLALMLLMFLSFAAAMRGLITFVVEVFQRRLFIRVVEDLAYRLPRSKHGQFDSVHGPELVNRFFDIVTLQKATAGLLLEGTSILLQTVIGMAVLAFYHPFLLGFDVIVLMLMAIAIFGLGRGAVNTAINESRAKYAVGAWMQELVRHPTAFKLHGGSQFALDRADQLAVNWLDARRQHFQILIRQILFALGVQALASTALLGLGGWLVIQGELTLGQLVAAELIIVVIVGSFAKLGKHMERFYDLLASTEKLGHLFDVKTEAHDKTFHLREATPAAVAVRGVTFRRHHDAVLRNVDFTLEPGSATALVGPPASGKSTLIDLLCGLRTPTTGHVELDGIDLRELRPDSLREHLSVARDVEIFSGSIDENVHMNRPHISAEDVREALDAVGLLDEVLKLPDGLNTALQTGGSPLTHSQTLRLILARALVGRPRLLLIDGTLDALPDATLPTVMERLIGPQTPWTLLLATGRDQLVKACDRVVDLGDPATHRMPSEQDATADH